MKTQVGIHVRSASVNWSPHRQGPSTLFASSQVSCLKISAIFASRVAMSMPLLAPCHAVDRYIAPCEWQKPSALQFGELIYISCILINKFMTWRPSGVDGVIASLLPYRSSRYLCGNQTVS